jgi:hypothetical protein
MGIGAEKPAFCRRIPPRQQEGETVVYPARNLSVDEK